MENPDAFAKKMRILKLEILGLKRKEEFNINAYPNFYLFSPATLMSKKKYCSDNEIDYKNNLSILKLSWIKIIRVNNTLSDIEANKKGKAMTEPFKEKYDKWMKEYKKWAEKFANRRGRRLIIRI